MKLDADAVLWSAPESERASRPLLVLLHGYGSHEGDLFGLSPRLPLEPVIASLRAPLRENGGNAWFSLGPETVGNPDSELANEAADAVLEWLDTLENTSVGLLGFSQGAAVALQLLRRAPERFDAVIALSGFVVAGTEPGDDVLRTTRPPVFWGRGTADRVIPAEGIDRTAQWLPTHATVTERIYEDLGHSVSVAELADINAFLLDAR